jgi:uncharacterized protein (DUF1330 family)
MQYLVASISSAALPAGCQLVADGETISFEEPWSFGTPMLAHFDDTSLEAVKAEVAKAEPEHAVATVALEPPGAGEAYVIAAHLMRDITRFRDYAAAVPGVVKKFGGRFLARAGAVTPIAESFVPDRLVLIEFPTALNAVSFYFSPDYAPLLKLRLETTDPRFVLVARSGQFAESVRPAIEEHLRARG